jgi:hypothetical protein
MSEDPANIAYRESFHLWGYPSDTFAIHYVRHHPWFTLHLQILAGLMLLCFAIMAGVLGYYTFVVGGKMERRRREQDGMMEEILKRRGNHQETEGPSKKKKKE